MYDEVFVVSLQQFSKTLQKPNDQSQASEELLSVAVVAIAANVWSKGFRLYSVWWLVFFL